jgi:hypothetical protein
MMPISVGPHDFKALKFWDRWRKNGRCEDCFLPKFAHPVHYWSRARPLFDRSEADLGVTKNGRK